MALSGKSGHHFDGVDFLQQVDKTGIREGVFTFSHADGNRRDGFLRLSAESEEGSSTVKVREIDSDVLFYGRELART